MSKNVGTSAASGTSPSSPTLSPADLTRSSEVQKKRKVRSSPRYLLSVPATASFMRKPDFMQLSQVKVPNGCVPFLLTFKGNQAFTARCICKRVHGLH